MIAGMKHNQQSKWRKWLRCAAWSAASGLLVCCVALSALATLGLAASPTGAQDVGASMRFGSTDTPPTTGPYSVSGMVVDSVTGAPIRRALVRLNQTRRAALTGDDGKFRLEGLPQTQDILFAMKPGYTGSVSGDAQEASVSVKIGADTPSVTVKLVPQGGITVQVTSDDSDAVEDVPVRVVRSGVQQGQRFLEVQSAGNTNEDGVFRAGNLKPGKYYVSVGPSYQAAGQALGRAVRQPAGQVSPVATAPDTNSAPAMGYARVFYPNAAEMEGAAPLEVGAGARVHVEISVATVPMYRISGVVAGGPPGGMFEAHLTDATGDDLGIGIRVNPRTGEFLSGFVAAGFYTVRVRRFGNSGVPSYESYEGSASVHVDSNVSNVTVAIAPPPMIRVNYSAAGEDLPHSAGEIPVVLLDKEGEFGPRSFMSMREREALPQIHGGAEPETQQQAEDADDARHMVIPSIEPGTYRAYFPSGGGWYVESARYGSVDLMRDEMVVPEGGTGEPIEIVVGNDGATLAGRVTDGGAAADGQALIVPGRAPRQVLPVPFSGGAFSIQGLAPGEYHVIALDSVDGLEYRNPEAMREYMSKAKDVTLGPKMETTVDLELVKREK